MQSECTPFADQDSALLTRLIAADHHAGRMHAQPLKTTPGLLVPANPPILDGVNDLTSLSYLNEPAILHDLRQRYSVDQVTPLGRPAFCGLPGLPSSGNLDMQRWPVAPGQRPQPMMSSAHSCGPVGCPQLCPSSTAARSRRR